MKLHISQICILNLFISIVLTGQTVHKYDLLERTDGDYHVIKKNVSLKHIKSSYYCENIFVNGRLTVVEYRDTAGRLYDGPYNAAVTKLYYGLNDKIIKTELYDSMGRRVTDRSGTWSEEYHYDSKNRIIKYVSRDTSNNMVEMGAESTPAYLEYKYIKDSVFVIQYSNTGTIIYQYMQKEWPRVTY